MAWSVQVWSVQVWLEPEWSGQGLWALEWWGLA